VLEKVRRADHSRPSNKRYLVADFAFASRDTPLRYPELESGRDASISLLAQRILPREFKAAKLKPAYLKSIADVP